jgi:hypothetical protein
LKTTYRVLTASAFLLPAFLISSCDDKNSTPVAPSDDPTVTGIEAPSLTTVGFGSRWHDPHIKGPKVRYFINDFACPGTIQAKRFKSEDGAELSTQNIQALQAAEVGSLEDFCAVGVYPVDQKIRGKLLTSVKELDFSYAGGDASGAPQMRIPIDCGGDARGISEQCTTTDGVMDAYAYIDAQTCHDGDAYVGVVNAEDSEDCVVRYLGYDYYDWHAFVDAHPNGRVARKLVDFSQEGQPLVDARTSVVLSPFLTDAAAHYLIWMIDVR